MEWKQWNWKQWSLRSGSFRSFDSVQAIRAARLPSSSTGAHDSPGVLLGGCPCETRSDSSAANWSLAHFTLRAKAGQILFDGKTAPREAESQAERGVLAGLAR